MADEELFDPGEHTVDQVNEHLADADPAEAARVLAAEETGKARVGILSSATAAVVEDATPEQLLGDDDPYEVIRAKDAAGNEYSTSRIAALNARSTVLAKPATDDWGRLLPTKTVLDFRAEATQDAGADPQPSTDHTQE